MPAVKLEKKINRNQDIRPRLRYQSPEKFQSHQGLLETKLSSFSAEIARLSEFGYKVKSAADVSPLLKKIAKDSGDNENIDYIKTIKTAVVLEIELSEEEKKRTDQHHGRRILLLEDKDNHKATVTAALHGYAPGRKPAEGEEYNVLLHGPAYFGGAGIYELIKDENGQKLPHLVSSLRHSEQLSEVMTQKAWACGIADVLTGTKVIIDKEGDWFNTPAFQFATGMMFSPKGVFHNIITGSDAGQDKDTIARMEKGSKAGGGHGFIVGTKEGIPDTASYVKHSMLKTYMTLRKLDSKNVPQIKGNKVAVQGAGKIGEQTIEMFLKKGAETVFVSDIFFHKETFPEDVDINDATNIMHNYWEKVEKLNEKYGNRVIVVPANTIYDQQVSIFAPCSSQEHLLNNEKIDKLKQGGVKLILGGGNNILADDSVAEYAFKQNIIMPNPIVSNNGSATAAAMEVRYLLSEYYPNSLKYVNKVLIPHIKKNDNLLLQRIFDKAKQSKISLYNATIELFLEDTAPVSRRKERVKRLKIA